MQIRRDQLKKNIDEIQSIIAGKATLVAVTKRRPISDIELAYQLGHRDFGENRVDEIIEKDSSIDQKGLELNWHYIGKIQTKKVKSLLKVKQLKFIHSIDSLKLLNKVLGQQEMIIGDEVGLFIQVNTSSEDEKSGFISDQEISEAVATLIEQGEKVKFVGLMTMGSIRGDNFEEDARECFSQLYSKKCKLEQEFNLTGLKLSMGMSNDLSMALEQHSDYVRVGTAIFKES